MKARGGRWSWPVSSASGSASASAREGWRVRAPREPHPFLRASSLWVVLLLPVRSATFSLNGYGSFSHRRLALLLLVLVLVVAVLGNYGGGSRRLMLLFFIEMTLDPADAAALESHTHRHPHQRLWSGNSGQPPQKRQLANRPELLDRASNLLGVDELDQRLGDGGLRGKEFAPRGCICFLSLFDCSTLSLLQLISCH